MGEKESQEWKNSREECDNQLNRHLLNYIKWTYIICPFSHKSWHLPFALLQGSTKPLTAALILAFGNLYVFKKAPNAQTWSDLSKEWQKLIWIACHCAQEYCCLSLLSTENNTKDFGGEVSGGWRVCTFLLQNSVHFWQSTGKCHTFCGSKDTWITWLLASDIRLCIQRWPDYSNFIKEYGNINLSTGVGLRRDNND